MIIYQAIMILGRVDFHIVKDRIPQYNAKSTKSSMRQLSEIIFTLLFTPLFGEKTTPEKLIGAISVFFGSIFILFKVGSMTMT